MLLRTGVLGERGPRAVAIALALFGWMTAMRLVRSQVIAVKSSDYVAAARAHGRLGPAASWSGTSCPTRVAPVLVYATITVGVLIAAEATLTYLGVGLQLAGHLLGAADRTGPDPAARRRRTWCCSRASS